MGLAAHFLQNFFLAALFSLTLFGHVSYFTADCGKTMENDKLKSIVLATGSIILLFLVATNPGLQKDAIWRASKTSGDSVGVAAAAKAPQFAGIVSRNMSFFDLMLECGLDAPSIKLIEKAARNVYDFRRIYPGQHYEVYAAEDGKIESMQFSVGDTSYIDINLKDGDISAEKKDYEFSTRLKTASGTITNSLYLACKEHGIPAEVGDQLANTIFAWDIDFHHEIQRGDFFKVIYEERIRFDGMKKIGRIVAAESSIPGTRATTPSCSGTRTADRTITTRTENRCRKQLLKAPLTVSRISFELQHAPFSSRAPSLCAPPRRRLRGARRNARHGDRRRRRASRPGTEPRERQVYQAPSRQWLHDVLSASLPLREGSCIRALACGRERSSDTSA